MLTAEGRFVVAVRAVGHVIADLIPADAVVRRARTQPLVNPTRCVRCCTIINNYQLIQLIGCKKGSPYSITERKVPELIPVLGSQPAANVSHKPGGRLPLLSATPAVTLATLNRAATNFAAR